MRYPYFLWDCIFLFIPTLIFWSVWWKFFLKYKKTFIFIAVGSFLWGFLVDYLATPVFHIYFYPHTIGVSLFSIPLEEYLFLLLVPQEMTALILLVRRKIYG